MRRIIERVVTVVTTTTWTITWQDDSPQRDPQPFDPPFGRQGKSGSVADNFPQPEVSDETAKHIPKFSSVTQTKEADPAEMKTEANSTADEPSQDPHPIQTNNERK